MFNRFLFLSVSVQFSNAYVNVLSIVVFLSLDFSFFDMFLFLKNFLSIYILLLAWLKLGPFVSMFFYLWFVNKYVAEAYPRFYGYKL